MIRICFEMNHNFLKSLCHLMKASLINIKRAEIKDLVVNKNMGLKK